MTANAWEGGLVRLRGLEPADGPTLQEHSADTEAQLAAGGAISFPISAEAGQRWLSEAAGKVPETDEAQLVIETLGGQLVGGINSHHVSSRNGTFRSADR